MGVFEDSISGFLEPVAAALLDETVSEILINGPHEIFVEKRGVLERISAQFRDETALQAAVRNIAQFVGRRIDTEQPTLDARLPDGSRIHAVLPPISRQGTVVSIRKFSKTVPTLSDLVQRGTLSKVSARFLDVCLYLGKNIIVSGGTGSGKTTLLNVLASRIPKNQRLIIIEDASELQVQADHVVRFETRAEDSEGKGKVSIRDLIRSALRLRPDRIIVGEVRGSEALDLITAMNTGHGGSMGTVHANTPYDALVRLETLSMMGDSQVPVGAIRRQIASAIQIVVQIKRFADGSRRITEISEVIPEVDDHGRYRLSGLFQFTQTGWSKDKKIIGQEVALGNLPTFMSEIESNRLPFGPEYFGGKSAKSA